VILEAREPGPTPQAFAGGATVLVSLLKHTAVATGTYHSITGLAERALLLAGSAASMTEAEMELLESWRAVAGAKLAEYLKQCWRLAALVRSGIVTKAEAVDQLWMIGIAHALLRYRLLGLRSGRRPICFRFDGLSPKFDGLLEVPY